MTQKFKRYLLATICSGTAMFLWVFVATVLTGHRDIGEFTQNDQIVMTLFAIVEIATLVTTFRFAILCGKEKGKRFQPQAPIEAEKMEKLAQRRGSAMLILAFALGFVILLGGIWLRSSFSAELRQVCGWICGISCVSAAAMLLLNILMKWWYAKRMDGQQVGQFQQFLYSHREDAEETAARKLSFLQKWRCFTACYAIVLFVLGVSVALWAGIADNNAIAVPFCFGAGLLILCGLSRIRFRPSHKLVFESEAYVSEEQYPYIYALAKRAAKTVGCEGQIRIALLPDCNAGIAKINQTYSIQLGMILLGTLSEDEIYSILLHEFSHMSDHNTASMKERDYHIWLEQGRVVHFLSPITDLFFSFLDGVYALHYSLYDYASTLQIESAADQAMLLCGDPATVASALLKLKYHELFSWEKGTQDAPCMYEPEEPEKHLLTKELEKFHQAIDSRREDWDRLFRVEIQSRIASHPTPRARLEALGIREPRYIAAAGSPEFAEDCAKALAHLDAMIHEDISRHYEAARKAYYLEPKAQVEAWEAAGKPLVAQEYSDIVWALRQLGRCTEAIELCDRAIAELSTVAGCSGYFFRGCYRLRSYDEAGIADIYVALENNSNYFKEGMDTIGVFCCLTGNQKELDVYRQKGVSLAQEYKDQYSQVGVLTKKDRLSAEKLPEGMLEDILAYIRSVENGQIEKIYLVRKTITEDFFTSVFVIRFDLEAEEAACEEIMHKIFQYLDTCSDWQFSLFDYQDVLSVQVYKVENSCVYEKFRRG